MKYTIAFALLAIVSIGFASCSNETTSPYMSQLPTPVQSVINDNFSAQVLSATTEANTFGIDEYEIILADGTKVSFAGEEWDEVEVPAGQSVPDYFVIEPIRVYVSEKMPDQTIVKIERNKKGYEIELSNKMEINFDNNGAFISVD